MFDLDLDAFDLDHDAPADEETREALAAILGRPVGALDMAEVLA